MTGRSFSNSSRTTTGSSSKKRRGVGSSFGSVKIDVANDEGGKGGIPGLTVVGRALSALDTGRRGIAAVFKEIDDLVPGITKSDREQATGFRVGDIKQNYRENVGAGDMTDTGNKWLDRAIGLAGDITMDPLSYVTLGVGGAALKGTKEGGKLAGRRSAVQVAREAAKEGDTELANRILERGVRGSTNAMTAEEAAKYGIRQGPTIGMGKNRVALPGGDAVARAASKALAPATKQVNKLPLHGIGNAVKGATPLQRQLARDADRTRRLLAKGANQTAKRELGKVLETNPDLDLDVMRDALEGQAVHPAATSAREILDTYHQWAEEQLGRKLPYYDDYLSHRLSPEARTARAAQGIESPLRKGGKPGVLKQRGYKPGDTFYGEVLQEGSITEMNRIYKAKVGAKHSLFEENPVKLIHQWIDDVTTMVERSPDSFATAAGTVEAPLRAVKAPGAKEAAKEARAIDRALKKAVEELDRTKVGVAASTAAARSADDAARAAVAQGNEVAAKIAVPEATSPGLLGNLPDADAKLAALKAAAGRDTTTATDELIELTGARPTGEMLQGEREFLMPDGHKVPERNILAHAAANVQLEDLKARHAAARADVAAKLRPKVLEQARTLDHVRVATDTEAVMAEASDNLKSLDALRVMRFKADQTKLALREEADRLYTEAARQRTAGDVELANVAALEAQARKIEADLPDLDRKWAKVMAKAGEEKHVRNIEAMARQGLVELADGRFAEPWVADAAQAISAAVTPAKVGRLVKEFDRVSGFWRASALLSPGFHMRNFFGAMFNNMLADMDWSRYAQFRQVQKAFEKGGLEAIKDPMLRRAVEAGQRLGQMQGADISDVTKIAGMDQGGRIVGRQNPLFRKNFEFGQRVEVMARMPLFIDTFIKSGGDEVAALDAVMKYHFDYDDLARMEREIGRRGFGFYTWTRNNLPLMIAEMADKPGVFNRYSHLKRNMELGIEEDEGKPSYFNKALAIALPFKFSGGRVYAFPDLPFISAGSAIGVNEMASNLNPLVKLPLETFTNTKFFEQRQFSPALRSTPGVWKPILQVLALNPGIPGLPKVHKAADGTLMMDEREANKIESMLPLLARMRRLAPSEDKYQDRVLTSWLSFVGGVSARTLDEATVGGEMLRRRTEGQKAAGRNATLEGGRTLDEYKAAQRQARAIEAARTGRREQDRNG